MLMVVNNGMPDQVMMIAPHEEWSYLDGLVENQVLLALSCKCPGNEADKVYCKFCCFLSSCHAISGLLPGGHSQAKQVRSLPKDDYTSKYTFNQFNSELLRNSQSTHVIFHAEFFRKICHSIPTEMSRLQVSFHM